MVLGGVGLQGAVVFGSYVLGLELELDSWIWETVGFSTSGFGLAAFKLRAALCFSDLFRALSFMRVFHGQSSPDAVVEPGGVFERLHKVLGWG